MDVNQGISIASFYDKIIHLFADIDDTFYENLKQKFRRSTTWTINMADCEIGMKKNVSE